LDPSPFHSVAMFQQTSDMHDKDEVVIDGLTQKELQVRVINI